VRLSTADFLDRRNDFAATKVPLCTWFRAMYHLTQSKEAFPASSWAAGGVTQTTWKIKHKLMQVMMGGTPQKAPDGTHRGDDAYLGGERNGGKRGRGSPGKTPIVAAVETTPQGKPIRLQLRRVRVSAVPKSTLASAISIPPAPSSVTACALPGVGKAGCVHRRSSQDLAAGRQPAFKWVTLPSGTSKAPSLALAVPSATTSRYLAEFEYRFNRRYDLADAAARLHRRRTPPMPYRLLKLAEDHV
jgi:hypothetical protein